METNPLLRLSLIARSCLQRRPTLLPRLPQYKRHLSLTPQTAAPPSQDQPNPPRPSFSSSLSALSSSLGASRPASPNLNALAELPARFTARALVPPHHLHIYSTKHNTHISLTRPDRSPIIVVSTGNLGFKKAARGTYDAAYQLGAYMMKRIRDSGLLTNPPSKEKRIDRLELILRGFGDGREAIKKILLGSEGMLVRPRIVRVTDATRLKFGGTRSKKPRRLG
ncbi:hypothetical protein MMC30_006805 [Trapelia coarctata]|nr:hypothetical protein [Trapelia coarctata]